MNSMSFDDLMDIKYLIRLVTAQRWNAAFLGRNTTEDFARFYE